MRLNADSHRGALGGLAALVTISLAISPRLPGHSIVRPAVVFVVSGLIVLICIWTAKSKAGVALGILAIVAFRFLVAGFFIASGAYRGH